MPSEKIMLSDADSFVLAMVLTWWCAHAFGWPNTDVTWRPR